MVGAGGCGGGGLRAKAGASLAHPTRDSCQQQHQRRCFKGRSLNSPRPAFRLLQPSGPGPGARRARPPAIGCAAGAACPMAALAPTTTTASPVHPTPCRHGCCSAATATATGAAGGISTHNHLRLYSPRAAPAPPPGAAHRLQTQPLLHLRRNIAY